PCYYHYSIRLFSHYHATPETSTLSLHDALPIYARPRRRRPRRVPAGAGDRPAVAGRAAIPRPALRARPGVGEGRAAARGRRIARSEEHTSELQSHLNLVCRLLLEKKNNQ